MTFASTLIKKGPVVLLRTDASPTIGGGHAMRCLTLADELMRRGGRCVFVAVEMTYAMHRAIIGAGHRIDMIDAGGRSSDTCQQSQAAATASIATRESATHLVIDHYRLDFVFAAHPGLTHLHKLAIDDLADRRLICDLLLDQTIGRDAGAYKNLASGVTLLIGGKYALLRPQFAAHRPMALQRRVQPHPAGRLLVSLGMTDVGGITAQVLHAILASDYQGMVDVVVSREAPSRVEAEAIAAGNPRIALHADVSNMAGLMVAADLAIGAAGTTTWERCALGVPTITLVLADNQQIVAREIVAAGAGIVSDVNHLAADLSIAGDGHALALMSAAAFALVDGIGTIRVTNAFLKPWAKSHDEAPIKLRSATVQDCEQLWLWRNDPLTRERSQSHAPIPRLEHERWFAAALAADTQQTWIVERGGHAVASTRIDRNGADGVVSIIVSPDARGTGVGSLALAATCAYWDDHADARGRLRAVIHDNNAASVRIFHRCGFTPETDGAVSQDGFRPYVRARPIGLETSTR